MSFQVSVELQAAVYRALRDSEALAALVGDAIYDALPVSPPAGTHVAIGPEDVEDAPDFAGIWPELEKRLAGRIVVAHNAQFDMSVLRASLRAAGLLERLESERGEVARSD